MSIDFQRIWVLRGPNRWSRSPVIEAELIFGDQVAPRLGDRNRLVAALPELGSRLKPDDTIAHAFPHLALLLQEKAGSPVRTAFLKETPRAGFYRAIVEYEEEALGQAAIQAARAILLAGPDFDIAAKIKELRELAHQVRYGPSTLAIVRAAHERSIPVHRLNEGSMVQLGWASRQRRIYTAETDRTSAIAEAIAQDKELTRGLLRAMGVPVPTGRPVNDADDAWKAAEELGVPVVVKPRYGNHGRGVTTNLSTKEQVHKAYAAAREESSYILVETFAPGEDHRLLVVGDQLAAAAIREPAHVVGDGQSTIRQLVDVVNQDPRRSDGHATVLSFIKLDEIGLTVLGEQGCTPESVPAAGVKVLIRRNGNLSTGGTATDVTDRVHPEVAAMAVDAARVIGLDIAGVDVVATDIGQPLGPQRGAVVEVNAGPGLRMHLEPSAGLPRAVGQNIIDMLFPAGGDGRIPIVAVTGVNGKTTTTRLIAHILRGTGKTVGMTCTDGTYINERRTEARDCSGPRSAHNVLLHPQVELAVFETARGGILREGLGFDRCQVAVVTNLGQGDHLGLRGIETVEELARVKQVVVEAVAPTGTAVLNAGDPLAAAMAKQCPGRVVLFHRLADHPVLAEHVRQGGAAALIRKGQIVLVDRQREEVLAPLDCVPMTQAGRVGFQAENALAGVAAAWSLQVPLEIIRARLASFHCDAAQAPSRFNVIEANGSTVIVDYAHNPSALAAVVEAVAAFPAPRRTLITCANNRQDPEVVAMGQIIGDAFDRVILYPDRNNNGRVDGELNVLLRKGLAAAQRVADVAEVASEREAIDTGLQQLRSGELLMIGVESVEEAPGWVAERLKVTR